MNNYSLFNTRNPVILLNDNGILVYDNKNNFRINFEVDYNLFSEEQLNTIVGDLQEEFEAVTTIDSMNNGEITNGAFIGVLINGKKEYLNIKTENSNMNFRFIKHKVTIYSNTVADYNKIVEFEETHSKTTDYIRLPDGDYVIRVEVLNTYGELISENYIELILKTNYYSMDDNKTYSNVIVFDKNEGNFEIEISPKSNKYYTFVVSDIKSDNDDIFYFDFYNKNNDSERQSGKIGSEFKLLNDEEIEEYEKFPEIVNDIRGEFIFNITKVLSSVKVGNVIGSIRIPTIKEKIFDNMNRYFNVKCDISSNYESVVILDETTLITDKFNGEPLFYKFLINEKVKDLKIINSKDEITENFFIKKLDDEVNIIYFSKKRNEDYYYINNEEPPVLIKSKKTFEPYSYCEDVETGIAYEEPTYYDNLIVYSESESAEVELTIVFEDYSKKTVNNFIVNKFIEMPKFLPDSRLKLNKKIRSINIEGAENLKIINFISNCKNLNGDLIYYKEDQKDFVYSAEEIDKIDLENLEESLLYRMKIGDKFVIKDNAVLKCYDGPLVLMPIMNSDIVFTDIDEYFDEDRILGVNPLVVDEEDEFYNQNFKRAGAIVWKK